MATPFTKEWLWNNLRRPLIGKYYGDCYGWLFSNESFFKDATLVDSYRSRPSEHLVHLYKTDNTATGFTYAVLTVFTGTCESCLRERDMSLLNDEERAALESRIPFDPFDEDEVAGVLTTLKKAIDRVYVTNDEQDARTQYSQAMLNIIHDE